MTWRKIELAMSLVLCAAGCYERSSELRTDQAAGRAAPTPPLPAADDEPRDGCDEPLTDWCKTRDCPRRLADARPGLCENEMGRPSLSAAELAPPHERAPNSCSGVSVTHFARDAGSGYDRSATTRYDYDADGTLVGATVNTTNALRECRHGKTCSITGPAERLCSFSCPSIACGGGLNLKLDATKPAAAYENAQLELCLNDNCTMGQLISDIPDDADYGVGVFQRMLDDGTQIFLTLWIGAPQPYLEVARSMYIVTNLHDGDRYSFKLRQSDGTLLYDLTELVERYDINEVGAPCTQRCQFKGIDRRGMSESDAGTP